MIRLNPDDWQAARDILLIFAVTYSTACAYVRYRDGGERSRA